MILGKCPDGRAVEYDERFYEFALGGSETTLEDLIELDDRGAIRWLAMEQRDWLRKIDARELSACQRSARRGRVDSNSSDLEWEDTESANSAGMDIPLPGHVVDEKGAEPVVNEEESKS